MGGTLEDRGKAFPVGIGSILRKERERRGFTYSQVFKITRLRPYILEALEHEDWESLPSPGFVTGFVRSYARALGLDEDEIVEGYRRTIVTEDTVLRPPAVPPERWKKLLLPISLVFVLVAGVSAYFIWREHPALEKAPVSTEMTSPIASMADEKQDKGQNSNQIEQVVRAREEQSSPALESVPADGGEDVPSDNSKEVSGPDRSQTKTTGSEKSRGLVLRAVVKERTWVRIFVDDKDPKEYIFQPGSEPEWTAEKGFELLIGNAGGIELELNGERVEGLGKRGQVVRLRLPKTAGNP
ncbi:MAG: RodZ domain-containing protein [Pseudomonadota bacterium]